MKSKHEEKEMHALQVINLIMADIGKCSKKVSRLRYRADYQDYHIIFDDKTVCGLREKLIADMVTMQAAGKSLSSPMLKILGDMRKDIQFRILHAAPLEDWEDIDEGEEPEEDIVL